jgi:hypothetical protein
MPESSYSMFPATAAPHDSGNAAGFRHFNSG